MTAQFKVKLVLIRRIKLCLFFLFLVCVLLTLKPSYTQAATGIYHAINFQGKVVNDDGTNVTDGDYPFVFKLYTVTTGGVATWTESKTLTVTNGIFRTELGDTIALPGSVDFNTDNIYLGIEFNSDGEMDPRVRFTAVPYAFNAEMVNGLSVTNNGSNTLDIGNGLTLAVTTASKTLTGAGTQLSFASNLNFGSSTSGSIVLGSSNHDLSFTTSGNTSLTLPTTGTLLTNTISANQSITSTQTSGTIFSLLDSTGLSGAVIGQQISLTGTGAFDQTGLRILLSGASGSNLNALVVNNGSTDTFALSKSGILTLTNGETIDNNTTDNTLILGTNAANGAGVLRLPVKTTTGDPALNSGGNIYYNSTDGRFRCFQGSAWIDCIPSSNLQSTNESSTDTLTNTESSILSATITPSKNTSQVWIVGSVEVGGDGNTNRNVTLRLKRGSDCATGTQVGVDMVVETDYAADNYVDTINFVDVPGSTSTQTYHICAITDAGSPIATNKSITLYEPNGGADSAGTLTVKETDGSPVVSNVSNIEFGPTSTSTDEFIVSDQTGGVARVRAGNQVGMLNQAETVSGGWTFDTATTSFTTAINANGGLTTTTVDQNLGFSVNGAGDFVFNVDSGSDLQLTGGADGTNALIIAAGNLTLSDGDLSIAGGDANFTLDVADTLNIAKTSANAGDVVNIAASSVNAVNALTLAVTSTADTAVDSLSGLNITWTESSDADSFAAVSIGNTTSTNSAATGISIGTGWDNALSVNSGALALNSNSITSTGAVTLTAAAASVWSTSNGLLTITGDDGITLNASTTAGITANMPDNITNAWDVQQGSDNYININTTDTSERVTIGNSTATNTGVTLDVNGTGTILLPDFANCTALETSSGVLTCGVDDAGAGSPVWSSIQAPSANLTLAMDADTTTFNWDTMTTQNGWTFGSAAPGFSSGDLVRIAQTSGTTMNDAASVTGNVLDISRSLTIDIGGARTISVSSPVVSITDNCTVGASDICTHSGNVLSLTQSFTSSTGAVLGISNTGTGAGISVALANGSSRTNGILIDQTGAGTTTNAFHITNTAGVITDSILIDGTAPTTNYLNTATIDITAAGAITGATGVSTTTLTASSAIAANGGITFDNASDTVGSFTSNGTILMNSNILQDIGNTGTDFIASTGALTLAGVLTANGGATISGGQNLTMSSGTGLFAQTHAVSTDATADSHTITLSAGGTGSTGVLRGLVVSQSDTATTGVFDSLGYFVNLKTPETTTNGILIENNASGGTLSNALHIINTAGTITDAILIDGTAPGGNILNTGTLDITGAGAITGATGITLASGSLNLGTGGITNTGSIAGATTITASSAIAANGGITFDNASDTLGSFTSNGTILMNSNILQDIGNTGTDFIASTGALTLAGVLTANGGITVAGGQNLTMSSGTGLFAQTHAPTTDATADAFSLSLSPGGTGSTNVLRGMVITQSDTGTTGVYDSMLYLQNLKTPETTTNGLFIEHNAASGTLSNGINITNTAGTLTTGLLMSGTFTNLIDTPTFGVSNAGTLTIASGQSYTGSAGVTLSSGGGSALTIDSSSNALVIAANDTSISRTASGTYTLNLVDGLNTVFAITNSGAGVANLQVDGLNAAACDVKADTSGILSCGTDAGAAASPFGSSGGVVTKTTGSDQVRLTMAQAGDYALLLDASTVPTVDLVQITNSGQGVTSTTGVDALAINYAQATNATGITGSAIDISVTQSGDASDIIRALTINNITNGASTEEAFRIGSGWDTDLTLVDTSPVIALGGDTTFTDGTNTLLTIDDQGTYGFLRLSDKGGAGDPGTCTAGDIYFNNTDSTFKGCTSTNTWEAFDNGADMQQASASLTETTLGAAATFITGSTAAVTPTTATGDVYVYVSAWTKSLSNTDQTITVQIRTTSGTTCGGSLLASGTAALTTANGGNGPSVFASYISVDPGISSQSFSVCALSSTNSGASLGGLITATVIDSGADLAEIYSSNDASLEAGDVVALDSTLSAGVKKSTKSYDSSVIGIVATNPGMVIGDVEKEGVKAVPVALAGRVPLKVSTENGPIKPNDLLTSSSTSGAAMKATKAGQIIGQAMTGFEGSGVGSVLVFIKTDYWAGSSSLDLTLDTESGLIDHTNNAVKLLQTLMKQKSELIQTNQLSEVVTDRLVAGLEVVAPEITVDMLNLNSIKAATGSDIAVHLTGDGKFAIENEQGEKGITFDDAGNAVFKGTITADKIKANQIEGLTILADQILTDKFEQNLKNLVAKEATEEPKLVTSSTTLTQQAIVNTSGLATGSAELDKLAVKNDSFFYGIVQIFETLSTGNLVVNEFAKFLSDAIFNGSVEFAGRATFNNDTAGTAIIKEGSNEVEILFEKEYEQTPLVTISLSFDDQLTDQDKALLPVEEYQKRIESQTKLENEALNNDLKYIVARKTVHGFVIKVNKTAPVDLNFSWNALAIKDPKTSLSKITDLEKVKASAVPSPTTASPEATLIQNSLAQVQGVSSASATLAKIAEPKSEPTKTTIITINDTETGFLRVRKEPATSSEEIGQVSPGTVFTNPEVTQGVGDVTWYKIEYGNHQSGWIKGSYVTETVAIQ